MAWLSMMRLASPALPIGGFSYSQGLESAIDKGWVSDEASLADWITDCLDLNIGHFEAPIQWHLCDTLLRGDLRNAQALHQRYLASRESAELVAETSQMGYSMLRLLVDRQPDDPPPLDSPSPYPSSLDLARSLLQSDQPCALPMAWAIAACRYQLSADQALSCSLYAWLENQIAAAIKAIPLGQQAGQRLLERLQPALSDTIAAAPALPRDEWSNFAPGFAMASSWHETQYSRLFRS